jgi:hypothetical protein
MIIGNISHSRELFRSSDEVGCSILENLLYIYSDLDVIPSKDVFFLMLDINLFRKDSFKKRIHE